MFKPNLQNFHFEHGTIIQTGITCKKILCYMGDSAYSLKS